MESNSFLKTLSSFLSLRAIWLPLAILLFFNLGFQYFQLGALTGYSDWDTHQLTYLEASDHIFKAENGVHSFQTYGPLYPYLKSAISPFSQLNPYIFHFAFIALMAAVFYAFIKELEAPYALFIVCVFLSLYNFPWISYAPFILTLWSLALKGSRNGLLHGLLGVLLVATYLLYKPSWGIIAFIQLAFTAIFHPRFEEIKHRAIALTAYALASLCLSFSLYLIVTNKGSLGSFIQFLQISYSDTKSYTSLMLSPLKSFQNVITLVYPIFIAIVLCVLASYKVYGKRFWLALILFPVLFAEYKHSYVRADYTNLKGIFWIFPLVCFFICLKYWSYQRLRYLTLSLLFILTFIDLAGFTPSNIPWRHPRKIWIQSPQQAAMDFSHYKQESKMAFHEHLKNYQWIFDEIEGKSLLVHPGLLGLSLFSDQPYLLPGNQNYFNLGLREQYDLAKIKEKAPDYLLFEDRLLDHRIPMSQAPELYRSLLPQCKLIQKRDDYYLFKLVPERKEEVQTSLGQFNIINGKANISFTAPQGIQINLKSTGLHSAITKLRTLLSKDDRIKIKYSNTNIEKEFHCSVAVLEKGTIMIPDLAGYIQQESTPIEHKLEFTGFLLDDYPYDPAHYLFSKRNGQLEVSYSILQNQLQLTSQ